MFFNDPSTPVVVFKSYHHGSLGIAGSRRMGVDVYGAVSDLGSIPFRSPIF